MAMDLSKGYSVTHLTRSQTKAMDRVKKPEWYHRRPASCGTEISPPCRTRSRAASSYNSLSTAMHPEAGGPVHCRDTGQGSEALGNYMNSTLAQGIGLYHEGVHGNLWHSGFYGPDQTGSQVPESSGDSVSHIVEPLSSVASSLDEGRGCYHLPQPLSSPSPDTSYSEESSDSSVDIHIHNSRPIVLLSDLRAVYGNLPESPVDLSSDDSDVIEVSVTSDKQKNPVFPCKSRVPSAKGQSGKSQSESEDDKPRCRELRRSSRIGKAAPDSPPFTYSMSRQSLRRQVKNDTVGIYNECYDSDEMEFTVRRSSSEDVESVSQPDLSARVSSNSDDSDTDAYRKAPSSSPQSNPHSQQSSLKAPYVKNNKRQRKNPLSACKAKRSRTKQKPNHRAPREQQPQASANKKATRNKKGVTRRRRKRCSQTGPSALFSPREPEIKLKYANIKEEKKEKRSHNFFPFVFINRRVCTVVNYQEEETTVRSNRGQRHTSSRCVSGFVPNTSCFVLGRLRCESSVCERTQVCCMCGQTANAVGLGDLHGPYVPAGLSADSQNRPLDCKEPLQEDGNLHRLTPSDECGGNDRRHPEAPVRLDECWIHEDCGIWSAGVFLVRGKLYGLGEAARLAQETICSTCQHTGAIMGCFQKGCARSYHYRCAIQSGCVLNEDNFSMRCPEHKNKLYTSVTRRQKR
ncbi:uncharacterized protein LOC142992736 isoform X2 [Genypterus blacodes]|uniref:uncharacterized protein LOC142992736 isoform X2 n=1 Tax=Genypterus blacodes TaxID=154954 RepID=UPI003F763D03